MNQKSVITLLIAIIMVFSLSACNGNSSSDDGSSSKANNSREEALKEAYSDPNVKECSDIYMNWIVGSYTGIENYIDKLKVYAPENKFTKVLEEEYSKVDIENMSDLEKDILDSLLINYRHSNSTVELKQGWAVGYDNNSADDEYRLIIMEVAKTLEDGTETSCYVGAARYGDDEWYEAVMGDADHVNKYTGIDVTKETGKCTYFEDVDASEEYTTLGTDIISNVYSKAGDLVDLLKAYYYDVYRVQEDERIEEERTQEEPTKATDSNSNEYETKDNSGYGDIDTNTCGSCGRKYNAGDSGGNYMNIAKTGMCKNCYNNYKSMEDYAN